MLGTPLLSYLDTSFKDKGWWDLCRLAHTVKGGSEPLSAPFCIGKLHLVALIVVYTALCNEVGPGELALLKGTLDNVSYLPA